MMCYNTTHIVTAGTGLGIVKNVFAERRELESPFRDVVPIFTRAFLLPKISGFNRFLPDSLEGYMKNEYKKKQALSNPDNLHHAKWFIAGAWLVFIVRVDKLLSNALIVDREIKSILTPCTGGVLGPWRKG